MARYSELEKAAMRFLDETDTAQFETFELMIMFHEHMLNQINSK